MGPLGVPELIFLFILALLIFGPKKLPELGRTIGKALTEFRRASNELRNVVEDEVREFERQTADAKRQTEETMSAVNTDLGSIAAGTIASPATGLDDESSAAERPATVETAPSPGAEPGLEKPAPVSSGPAPTDA